MLDGEEVVKKHHRSRAIVSEDTIYSYIDTFDGPQLDFEYRLEDFYGDNKVGFTAVTSDGYIVQLSRSQDCLCGSRLRGFDPFPGVPYIGYAQ